MSFPGLSAAKWHPRWPNRFYFLDLDLVPTQSLATIFHGHGAVKNVGTHTLVPHTFLLLLFDVTSYADMPAYTGFRDLIHYHAAR